MADRYWVGGTANWDATAGTKWALTSGGAGGQAVPTSSDDVYFDAASGAVTVTINATANCRNLTTTTFAGTLAGASLINLFGNLVFTSGFTYSHTGQITYSATDAGHTITTAGKTMSNQNFNGVGGAWTLQDDLNMLTRTLTLTNGDLTVSNRTINLGALASSNSNTRVLTCTNTVWNFDGTVATAVTFGTDNATRTSITFSGAGSAWNFTRVAATNYVTNFNGKTVGSVQLLGAGIGAFSLLANSANMVISTLTNSSKNSCVVTFSQTRTYTITNWAFNGGAGRLLTLQSGQAGNAFVLAYAGAGVVSGIALAVKDCTGTPATTWFDRGLPVSVMDLGGNTGWTFSARRILTQTRTAIATARTAITQARVAATARTTVG